MLTTERVLLHGKETQKDESVSSEKKRVSGTSTNALSDTCLLTITHTDFLASQTLVKETFSFCGCQIMRDERITHINNAFAHL